MELLQPAHPLLCDPTRIAMSGLSPSGSFRLGSERSVSGRLPEIAANSGSGDKIYVAVGKSVGKASSLLHWTFGHFKSREICLLHVHQPSPVIPTLLGKLPASQANAEVVSAYRREEREQTRKLLQNYLSICCQSKVKASILTIEADQIQKGIIELINRHGIRKLVMGAIPESCMKVKRSSSKANYAARHAPLFSEIWFVHKGRHLWKREASECPGSSPPFTSKETRNVENCQLEFDSDSLQSSPATSINCTGTSNWIQGKPFHMDLNLSASISGSPTRNFHSSSSHSSASTGSDYASAEVRVSVDSESKVEEESLYLQFAKVRMEAEAARNEALAELLKRKKLESEAMEAMSKVKVFESAYAHETELQREIEVALRSTIQEQEKLLEEREEVTRELQRTMRNVALLDNRAQEANRRGDQAAGELKVIQASIATLRQEKHRIRQQKMEAVRWLERWRNQGQAGSTNCNAFIGFDVDLPELAEFPLSDLQTATCNFSENFKIGQGGHGCVYKGEMLGRTVAIKKLHPYNMQGQSEFQQEVQVLGKLQHPHLVTLLGVCPEAWSLVYEYLPNGSLQDRLFRKNISPMAWKTRVRIIAEISSALCFLHSCKPEKIVHGDLKPQNILLDSELSCKICDFGICRLVTEDTLYCASFRRISEPKGAFPYADPEFHRIGVLTPKSDIYSFGLIILQLLTGRPPVGLVDGVRKAVSYGKSTSILDSSAGEWPTFVARRLLDLGLHCCELYSRDRPDLTPALVRELEQLYISEERPVPSFFLCPILQEIMHDPQVAADGFTYEGHALQGWLSNGRETSPMTNLKLSHLQLTPNHALRLAIQDWLCKS